MQVHPPAQVKPPLAKSAGWPLFGRLRAIFNFDTTGASAFEFNALARENYELGICRVSTPEGIYTAVIDPELVEQVMTQGGQYGKEPLSLSRIFTLLRLGAGNGLFTADDSDTEWGIAHRILAKPFSRQGMASFVPLMNVQADLMVAALERHIGFGGTTSMDEWLAKMSFEIIA
jgi:cytochrome P450